MVKRVHYFMGIVFAAFIAAHLFNHLAGLFGIEIHIAVMNSLRAVYRNPAVEALLLLIVLGQILSGMRLVLTRYRSSPDGWTLLQILSGSYLAVFLLIHVSAVLFGRIVLKLDTNVYFAMAGLNTAYYRLFFIPYYTLAIMSVFGHVAAIHQFKMQKAVIGLSPRKQSMVIVSMGMLSAVAILYAMTGGFSTASFPSQYGVLVGK